MSSPFDGITVTDMPEHVVPNHKVKAETDDRPTLLGKLRGGTAQRDPRKAPALPKERKEAPPYREGMYIEPMRDFYEFLAVMMMPFRPKAWAYLATPEMLRDDDTGVITEGKTGAQKCAEAWDAAAKKSPAVRRMLESFLVVSVWGTLVAVHVPLIIAMMDKGDSTNPFAAFEEMLRQHAGEDEK